MPPYGEEEWLTKLTWIIVEIENKKLAIKRLIFGDPLFTPIEYQLLKQMTLVNQYLNTKFVKKTA